MIKAIADRLIVSVIKADESKTVNGLIIPINPKKQLFATCVVLSVGEEVKGIDELDMIFIPSIGGDPLTIGDQELLSVRSREILAVKKRERTNDGE